MTGSRTRLDPFRPKVPDVLPIAAEYMADTGMNGGNLHIVLADDNTGDGSVEYCLQRCIETKDKRGEKLARLLLAMSYTGRRKVVSRVWGCCYVRQGDRVVKAIRNCPTCRGTARIIVETFGVAERWWPYGKCPGCEGRGVIPEPEAKP